MSACVTIALMTSSVRSVRLRQHDLPGRIADADDGASSRNLGQVLRRGTAARFVVICDDAEQDIGINPNADERSDKVRRTSLTGSTASLSIVGTTQLRSFSGASVIDQASELARELQARLRIPRFDNRVEDADIKSWLASHGSTHSRKPQC